jgi:hypothetical protein
MAVTAQTTQDWTVLLTADAPGPGTWTRVTGDGREVVVGDTQTAEDRWAPIGVPLVYSWATQAGVETTDPVTVDSDRPVLSSAIRPGGSAQVVAVSQQPVRWEGRSVAHEVLSRPDPVVTMAPPKYHTATLRLHTDGRDGTDQVLVLLATGAPLILRTPCRDAVRDCTLLPLTWTEDVVSASRPSGARWLDIDYQAVTTDPMVYGGLPDWSWETLAAVPELSSYDDVVAMFGTWAATARGPV